MMDKGKIHIYTGDGHGKTPAALGEALYAASAGKQVVIIQFMKGKGLFKNEFTERLEPEIKFFCFEKAESEYVELNDAQQAEEKARAYAHVQYGLDVSNRLICDTQDMIVYDYVLYYGESDDSDDMEALENSCSPMWVISFQGPLYDGNNMDND